MGALAMYKWSQICCISKHNKVRILVERWVGQFRIKTRRNFVDYESMREF